jgi:hypothetical protein
MQGAHRERRVDFVVEGVVCHVEVADTGHGSRWSRCESRRELKGTLTRRAMLVVTPNGATTTFKKKPLRRYSGPIVRSNKFDTSQRDGDIAYEGQSPAQLLSTGRTSRSRMS